MRAFANTGFRGVIGVSGHSGGSQEDLRLVARIFSERFGIPIVIQSDPEWVAGLYEGDHAGAYEISQLLAIEPELINLSLLQRGQEADSGGRLALGEDAAEATTEKGHEINEAILSGIAETLESLPLSPGAIYYIEDHEIVDLWKTIISRSDPWHSRTGG
ncbi:creatininase family protein [bacterium]|nr:creatininase family protein [bacterium]